MKYLKKVSSTPLTDVEGHIIDSFDTSDDHTTNAPSLNAVENNYISNPVVLYDNPSGSNGTITLSDNVSNYTYLEVYFFTNDGWQFSGYQKCMLAGSDTTYHCLQFTHCTTDGRWWIKAKVIAISGTRITNSGYVEIYSGGQSVSNFLYIRRVLGYK